MVGGDRVILRQGNRGVGDVLRQSNREIGGVLRQSIRITKELHEFL